MKTMNKLVSNSFVDINNVKLLRKHMKQNGRKCSNQNKLRDKIRVIFIL